MPNISTHLLYLEDFNTLTHTAHVESITPATDIPERFTIVLDQTIFYPQGGGQPYDQGTIQGIHGIFEVVEVRYADGVVRHIGRFMKGAFTPGDAVTCEVNGARRSLHSRLHSAGHVVDMAVAQLKLDWKPGKGFHFPEGPYVEYYGSLEGLNVAQLVQQIEHLCNTFVQQKITTRLVFTDAHNMANLCRFVPDNLPRDKPSRVVLYGDFGVPCGGTHVHNLADIGHITIRKVKVEKGAIRVSYSIG